jgi:hypothetical protein
MTMKRCPLAVFTSVTFVLSIVVIACSPGADTPERASSAPPLRPPAALVDAATFDPLYRAVEAIDQRIRSANRLANSDFTELLDGVITEMRLASNRVKSEDEERLLGIFADVAQSYQDSAWLWGRVAASRRVVNGIVLFEGEATKRGRYHDFATRYALPVHAEVFTDFVGPSVYTHTGRHIVRPEMVQRLYQVVPADSVQRVWKIANRQFEALTSSYQELLSPPPRSR